MATTTRSTALLAAFFGSGAAALIYQVVWQRTLTLYYGVGALTVTLIVALFMLGLGLGALIGGALAERVRAPAMWYVGIEAALGLFGLGSLKLLALLGEMTTHAPAPVTLAAMVGFLALPTLAMGTTLPLLIKATRQALSRFSDAVGLLYFVNTLGAAVGALVSAWGLISWAGLDAGVACAAGLNLGVAALVAAARPAAREEAPPRAQGESAPAHWRAWGLVFCTGFVGLGYEIVWFRLVELLVKASPYAFATVLAIYLAGIALGARKMASFLRAHPERATAGLYLALQFFIGLFSLASITLFYHLTKHSDLRLLSEISFLIPLHPPLELPSLSDPNAIAGLFATLDIVIWPLLLMGVPTLLFGAGFPLITTVALTDPSREGATAGHVYFFNTAGNVAGSVVTGLLLLPALGSEGTLLLFGLVQVAVGGVGLAEVQGLSRIRGPLVALVVAFALVFFPGRRALIEALHIAPGEGFDVHTEEGLEGVVVTYTAGERVLNYIGGLGHGGRPGYAFYREAVEALSYVERPTNVLVVGMGTGSVLEVAQRAPGVESITLVELSGTLMTNLLKLPLFEEMLSDQRLTRVHDDGRRLLRRSGARYHAILLDPLRSTTAWSNNLYSVEAFQLMASRLEPGGVVMVWLDEFDVLPRTLAHALPHVRVYNYFALASNAPLAEQPGARERLFAALDTSAVEGTRSYPVRLIEEREALLRRTEGLPINTDLDPVCEYYLGRPRAGAAHHP